MVARDGIEPPTPAFSGLYLAFAISLRTHCLVVPSRSTIRVQVQPNATIGSFGFAQSTLKVMNCLAYLRETFRRGQFRHLRPAAHAFLYLNYNSSCQSVVR